MPVFVAELGVASRSSRRASSTYMVTRIGNMANVTRVGHCNRKPDMISTNSTYLSNIGIHDVWRYDVPTGGTTMRSIA